MKINMNKEDILFFLFIVSVGAIVVYIFASIATPLFEAMIAPKQLPRYSICEVKTFAKCWSTDEYSLNKNKLTFIDYYSEEKITIHGIEKYRIIENGK